jgi:hypothetical protein
MSEVNDLIHRISQLALETGVRTERHRIIRLLESQLDAYDKGPVTMDDGLKCAIALIQDDHAHV